MRFYAAPKVRRTSSKRVHRSSHRLLLEWLEERVVPSLPDGTILVTTSPSLYSPTGDPGYPIGIYGVNPGTEAQFPISIDNPDDQTGHFDLFSLPTYVCEGPDGQLYVSDLQAFTTGAIIRVDPNTGQQFKVASGQFIDGPNALAFVNGFLYVANEADGSGTVHTLVRVDPNTGAQTLISSGDNGTSSGFNASTGLNDTTKTWVPNQWAGWTVVITSGTGAGQNATVTSNTATQLTLAGAWDTIPDTTSAYTIGFSVPTGMVPGPNNTVYLSDEPGGYIGIDQGGVFQVNLSTGLETEISHAGSLLHPTDISLEASGNLIVLSQTSATNGDASLIRVVPSTGAQSFVFTESAPYSDNGIAVDQSSGMIFIGAYSSGINPGEVFAVDPATGNEITVITETTTLSLVEGISVYHTTVQPAATTTTLISSTNPSVSGQSVTFTATVSPQNPSSNTPTGTVQFQIDGSPVGGPVTVTSTGSLAIASLSTNTLTAGTHTITATYSGDGNFAGSIGALGGSQVVNKASTNITVISSGNPALSGQLVTLTATISVTAPGAGTPTGSVQFQIDGGNAGSPVTLSTAGGVTTASFSIATLAAGTHTVTAIYSGDDSFASSISALAGGQVINTIESIHTTTAVASSANPSVFGQSVTFMAIINPASSGSGPPTGTVQFQIDGSNVGSLVTVSTTGGVTTASLSVSMLAAGTHTVMATYSGDGNFGGSIGSLGGSQVVNRASTNTAVTSSGNPVVFGQLVTFTATISVQAPGAGTPTGTVQFQIDGSPLGAAVGVATTNGLTTASFSSSTLPAGTHTITAIYSGDSSFAGSVGSLPASQVVNNTSNVTATLNPSTGLLSITGDTSNDVITLKQTSTGVLQLAGIGTLVNQSTNPANFSLGAITEIDISWSNGNDSVTMNGFGIRGNISIMAGSGSNTFSLGAITASNISISAAGPGKDAVALNSIIASGVNITAGDNANFSLSGVNSSGLVKLSAGNNATINVSSLTAAGDLDITAGDNTQSVSVMASSAHNVNILQTGTSGSPLFDLEHDTISNDLSLTAGAGNNTLVLSYLSVATELLMTLGAGKNTVKADHVTALFGYINGGPGGNNSYIDGGGNIGYSVFNFIGH